MFYIFLEVVFSHINFIPSYCTKQFLLSYVSRLYIVAIDRELLDDDYNA
jgi:hypothetical protein